MVKPRVGKISSGQLQNFIGLVQFAIPSLQSFDSLTLFGGWP